MIKFYKNIARNFLSIIPFAGEFSLLNYYSSLRGHPLRNDEKHKRLKKVILKYVEKELIADAKICTDLNFERKPLTLSDFKNHFKSLISVYIDYNKIIERRNKNDLKTSSSRDYPKYFNRNFHFQTDGYTSEESASLYDHQVEILFTGMASPMRRLILEEIKEFKDGSILELACGTGTATEMVAKFLPNSHIDATDISFEYISFAQKNRQYKNIDYIQMDATKVSKTYDCIFHVFLLHELPSKERREVIQKQIEFLNPGGKGIIIESLQVGDVSFLDEVLYDFPKFYHEPFFKSYIENPIETMLKELGAKNIKVTKRLFSKCVTFTS